MSSNWGSLHNTGYDAVGNISSITDSVGNTASYTYDPIDRRLTDTNQLGKTRSYGYDAVGDLIATTDRNGRKRTYNTAYRVNSRVKSVHFVHANSFLAKLGTVRIDRHLETIGIEQL
jgi:YD repeat-containing protein